MKKIVTVTATQPEYKQQLIDELTLAGGSVVNPKSTSYYSFDIEITQDQIDALHTDPRVDGHMVGTLEDNGIVAIHDYAYTGKTAQPSWNTVGVGETSWHIPACSNSTDTFTTGSGFVYPQIERNLTGKGVDIVMTEPLYKYHPEFLDDAGNTRVVELNWPVASGTEAVMPALNMVTGYDPLLGRETNHGNGCWSTAAGRTCGFAKDAMLYPFPTWYNVVNGTVSTYTFVQIVNMVWNWHLKKRAAGNMRPTVFSASTSFYFGNCNFEFVRYRGVDYPISINSTLTEKNTVGITTAGNGFPAYYAELAAEVKTAVQMGVIMCSSAGNNSLYKDVPGGPDWDNTIRWNNGGYIYYNRGSGWPGPEAGHICVGNIEGTITNNKRTLAASTARGPGVAVYAPGDQTIGASSLGIPLGPNNTWGNSLAAAGGVLGGSIQYPGSTDPDARLGRCGGTSTAAPVTAGVMATWCEANPKLDGFGANALIREFSKLDRVNTPTSSFGNLNSFWNGDTPRFLYTPYATTKKSGIGL